jgi:hypothetical protein
METMTRLLTAAAAMVLLVAFVGCCASWTAGQCDCDPGNGPCNYGPTVLAPNPASAHMLHGETMSPPMARADR